jgi:SAM-dependent methyltransferase
MLCQRRETCRLCGGRRLQDALRLTPTPLANAFVPAPQLGKAQPEFPLEVVLCPGCGHAQLHDVVDPGVLFRDYVYVSGTSPTFVRHFEEYAQDIVSRFGLRPGDRVVDIGSNDGTLLKCFKRLGLGVLGIDPATGIAAAATREGIETIPEFLTPALADAIVRERGAAGVVTANNVFAHVDDLLAFTGAVRRLLREDGIFVFEVSYLVDVFEKCLFDTIYHEHLDYHSVGPLVPFFERANMQLIHVSRVGSHGGSIRGVAQLRGGRRPVDVSVAALSGAEREIGLDRKEAFAEFGARIDRLGAELRELLGGLKSTGKIIGGFGAPAKATTLMYHFGIGADIIDFVIDDSPQKQGLYTPGMHIPVVPASEIATRRPDVLVILAWNFADSIIAKHAQFTRGGGTFVVPVPELRVMAPR